MRSELVELVDVDTTYVQWVVTAGQHSARISINGLDVVILMALARLIRST